MTCALNASQSGGRSIAMGVILHQSSVHSFMPLWCTTEWRRWLVDASAAAAVLRRVAAGRGSGPADVLW